MAVLQDHAVCSLYRFWSISFRCSFKVVLQSFFCVRDYTAKEGSEQGFAVMRFITQFCFRENSAKSLSFVLVTIFPYQPGGGGGYCQIWAIWVFATVKGMVLKQFNLG